jgi:uncharacterized protein (TIGR04255 family)
MSTEQHYSRAPITEVLIDIRVKQSPEISLKNLAAIHKSIRRDYPSRQIQRIVHGEVMVGDNLGTRATQVDTGYLYASKDGKRIFQARLDGFTFNQLAPYDRWETLRDEAKRLWAVYQQAATPLGLTRVAIRTINRLNLPGPLVHFSDYLRTVPDVSADLQPQALNTYFMQLQIPQDDIDAMLVLNEAFEPQQDPDVVSVILDIDLFRDVALPENEEGVWELFEVLRVRKNQVFEASITDRTRELIR